MAGKHEGWPGQLDFEQALPPYCGSTVLGGTQGPSTAEDPPGVGLVFVEFEQQENATRAQAALNGRKFGEGRVAASFYKAAAFHARRFE